MKIFDATDAVAGRMAALTAHELLKGEQIVILNAEKAIITGPLERTVNVYFKRRLQQQKADPEKSPSQGWSRRPDLLVRRMVRGMLPKNNARGRDALRRLRVYLGTPREFDGKKTERPVKTIKDINTRYATLQDVCKGLGWNPYTA
ncbi:MAG TPA: 50S ribosomal protein L13 [Candidatus Norongarragalinales archaeon]|jgi:large subunit ribosomal protein L13|nr:50S ribosomal protein L13 [Candidatus Norongarragalinales archaeon]